MWKPWMDETLAQAVEACAQSQDRDTRLADLLLRVRQIRQTLSVSIGPATRRNLEAEYWILKRQLEAIKEEQDECQENGQEKRSS